MLKKQTTHRFQHYDVNRHTSFGSSFQFLSVSAAFVLLHQNKLNIFGFWNERWCFELLTLVYYASVNFFHDCKRTQYNS